MIVKVYRVKLVSVGNPVTVMGSRYHIVPQTGILTVYEQTRRDGGWSEEECLTAAHGKWAWIRKIEEREV